MILFCILLFAGIGASLALINFLEGLTNGDEDMEID
jgi:hypothetical protein